MNDTTCGLRRWRWTLVIVLLALLLRIGSALSVEPGINWVDGYLYDSFARSLREEHKYLNPAGQPSALRSPGYPVFISIAGCNTTVVRILQACIGAITVLLAYSIALRLIDKRKALLAAVFVAIYPPYVYVACFYYPVVLLTLFLAGVLLLLLDALEANSGEKAFFAGLLGGIMALTKSSCLPAFGVAFIWIIWENSRWGRNQNGVRREEPPLFQSDNYRGSLRDGYSDLRRTRNRGFYSGLRMAVLFMVPLLLVIGTWSLRNYRAIGFFTPISTMSGYNFWLSNFPATKATTGNRNIMGRVEEELSLRNEYPGEAELDRAFYSKGFEYIKADPARFAVLSISKALNYWRLYPKPMSCDLKFWEKIAFILSYGMLLPFGLYWLIRNLRRKPGARLILLIFISYTLLHAICLSKVRFRLPLDMLLIISATGGIGDCAKRLGSRILEP